MIDNHVNAFFHGHDHQYAYEKRDGIVYQSLPAAGFSGNGFDIYSVGTYTLKVLPSPGHLRVTVTPTQATVNYITYTPGQGTNGQVVYSYNILADSGIGTKLFWVNSYSVNIVEKSV
jgi:3',5'-cyclic AMP phosphodiesterase CpdA